MRPATTHPPADTDPPTADAVDPADRAACLRVLRKLADVPDLADELADVGQAVARAYKRVRKGRRKRAERAHRTADRAMVEATGRCDVEPRPAELLAARSAGIVAGPQRIAQGEVGEACDAAAQASDGGAVADVVSKPRSCYVCKTAYRRLHAFYHLLCPACADDNYARRAARADLTGRRALVTGGRIKIGYQTALKLLRDGAHVVVTTRFPRDAAERYAAETDFPAWRDRLRLYGLDLRNMPAVYALADHLAATLDGLDIVINNAAQTIRREPSYFRSLYEREAGNGPAPSVDAQSLMGDSSDWAKALPDDSAADAAAEAAAPANWGARRSPVGPAPHRPLDAMLPDQCHWPDDLAYDAAGLPRDARAANSWVLELPDVAPAELAEAMLVNAMAPFALCSRLEPLLRRSRFADRYVVNVSAMEGRFDRGTKTSRHPHTNMAKAALNMLTRTVAGRLAGLGIFMNSVDTGWVTEENPHPKRARLRTKGFVPPLVDVDGAARVYDPIVRGVRDGERLHGLFLKDYRPISW